MENYMFRKLQEHFGHDIEIVYYGDYENPVDFCLECNDCGCIIIDAEGYDD